MALIVAALGGYVAAFLAALLAASAAHKVVARGRLAAAVTTLTGMRGWMAAALLSAAALAEAGLALGLLWPASRAAAALCAAALWAGYLMLILRAAGHGGDCGCSFGRPRAPSGGEAARNLALVALALIVGPASRLASPTPPTALMLLAGAAFVVLYAAIDQVAAAGLSLGERRWAT